MADVDTDIKQTIIDFAVKDIVANQHKGRKEIDNILKKINN